MLWRKLAEPHLVLERSWVHFPDPS
jgi:hypothetical protein